MSDSDDTEDRGDNVKASAPQAVPKLAFNKFHLKCANCNFRASSTAALEKHAHVKHLDLDWFRCKLCNIFTATSEWMTVHLKTDGHLQKQKEKNDSECSSFQAYVESVSRDSAGVDAGVGDVEVPTDEEMAPLIEGEQKADEAAENSNVVQAKEEHGELEPPKKKRGRPKQTGSITCEYCGLIVSNATNLSVHVRRKHSKEYGYSCTLCNYSCVTKGDMDRHCFTKKHIKRAQDGSNKTSVTDHIDASLLKPIVTHNSSFKTTDTEQESSNSLPQEFKVDEQSQSDTPQQTTKYDSVNACSLCDFAAQSISSLHIHVKRKHTKDFEYVCLACGYYAVTSKEMCRHANTEKHRQKSVKYLEMQVSKGQRGSELPLEKKNNDPPDELQHPNPSDASDSYSNDNQILKMQNTSASPATSEIISVVIGGVGSADEEQVKVDASSGGDEPDSINQTTEFTVLSEVQEISGELQLSLEKSSQQDSQEEGNEQKEDESLKADMMIVDMNMSKVPPFDACILSLKALAKQERALVEDLAVEGESSVISLTGGPSFDHGSSAYVRKLKPKEAKNVTGGDSHLRCEDCGFVADGLSGLSVHISMKHPSKERHFHCLLCGKSFYTESSLHQHLTSSAHIRNEQNSVEALPEGGASFKCVKCTDRFDSEQDLFFHIKEKHEELLKEVSKYVLEDTEQINREREENKGSVCKYCGKVCKSTNSMAFLAHIRTHTGR